jgi:hypothetical protein
VPRSVIVGSGYAWALLMFALGAGNLVVALYYDRAAWTFYNAIVPLAAKFGAFGIQYLVFRLIVRTRLRSLVFAAE